MPKRRAEQLASEQQAGEHEALERTVATAGGGGAGSPPLKRPRGAPLNFSIESIMQPAGVAQHQHQQQHLQSLNLNLNYHHAQHLHQLSQLNQLSHQLSPRSSSPASSLASSRSGASELSSCASPIEISSSGSQQRQRRRHHQDHQRRRRPKRERGEEARLELGGGGGADSPNATISRASTPISPGGVGELPGDQSDSGSGGALRQQAALAAAFGRSFAANMKADYRGPAADLKGAPASYQNPLQQQQHEQQRASIIKSEQHSTSSLSSASSASSATSGAPPTRSAHKSRPPNHSEPAASTSAQQASGGAAAAAANPHLSLSSSARLNQVECVLDNKEMWDKFHSLNTEMIITKTGRRMFPVLKVQFYNLDPSARYAVSMDIVPVDNKRYRYAYHKSCWQVAGKADPSAEPRLYPHPDSPFNGDLLARQVISFEKVKLTNNEMDKSGHIILNSMHKYQPRVHLIELKSTMPPVGVASSCGGGGGGVNGATKLGPLAGSGANTTGSRYAHQQAAAAFQQQQQQQQQKPTPQLDIEGYRTYVFPETVFTAVTAYQNQLITKMKIDKNPFAKGFRDSSRLSDLDRSDPFDYMSSLGPAAACAAAAAAAAHAHRGMGMGVGVGPGGFAPGAAAASQAAMLMMSSSPHHHHHHLQQQQQLLDGQPGGMPPGPPQPPGNANNPNNPNHLDQAYAQLIAAAQNPWYAAAAAAAAASGAPASNPFGPLTTAPAPPPPPAMPATPTSAACGAAAAGNSAQQQQQQQQQQLQATQMWLAAFSACLSGNAAPPGGPPSPGALGSMLASPASNRPTPTRGHEDARSPPI